MLICASVAYRYNKIISYYSKWVRVSFAWLLVGKVEIVFAQTLHAMLLPTQRIRVKHLCDVKVGLIRHSRIKLIRYAQLLHLHLNVVPYHDPIFDDLSKIFPDTLDVSAASEAEFNELLLL